jgi:hypothetical protein
VKLIENSFNYSKDNKFDVDFYPLMEPSNHQNNFLLLQDNNLIGHIGVLIKSFIIDEIEFKVPMFGGIAIDPSYRGKGYFKEFFNHTLDKFKGFAFNLLWSNKLELYEKFEFHPCIKQFEYNTKVLIDNPTFIKYKLKDLDNNQIKQLSYIYNQSKELRYKRSIQDWNNLKKITSSDIFIKENNNIISNYFFQNKGEDLNEVIYEYGHLSDIQEILGHGVLWSPFQYHEYIEYSSCLYASLLKICDINSFKEFVHLYTQKHIKIQNINDKKITFFFEKNQFELSIANFLEGIFGPNQFTELDFVMPILISGLDSI